MADSVTVVIPTKNRREMLTTTLRSIVAQRDVPFQVVVVDDGSTDGTRAHVERLGLGPVRVISSGGTGTSGRAGSLGVSAARNAGIAEVTTEWVAFCDDDDLWAPDKLAAQLAALADRPAADWCIAGSIVFDSAGRFTHHGPCIADDTLYRRLLVANVVPGGGSGVVVRTALARELGGFDTTLHFAEDWEMWLRLARVAPAAAVNRPLVAYRYWPASATFQLAVGPALDRLAERYDADRRRYGVHLDADVVQLRAATDAAVQGRRVRSAQRFLRLARMEHNPRKLGAAALALVAPHRLEALLTSRTAALVPADWIAEVSAWLPALLRAPAGCASVP